MYTTTTRRRRDAHAAVDRLRDVRRARGASAVLSRLRPSRTPSSAYIVSARNNRCGTQHPRGHGHQPSGKRLGNVPIASPSTPRSTAMRRERRRHAEANPCGCRSCCCSEAHRNATNTSSLNITSLHYIPVPKSGSESTKGTLFSLALNHSCYVRSGPHKMSLSARPISYPWLTGAPLGGDLVFGTLREPEERFLSTFEAFLGKKHSVQKLNRADAAFFEVAADSEECDRRRAPPPPRLMPFLTSVATCRGSCAGHFCRARATSPTAAATADGAPAPPLRPAGRRPDRGARHARRDRELGLARQRPGRAEPQPRQPRWDAQRVVARAAPEVLPRRL